MERLNLGLINMNARYFVPEVGRFASPDTLVLDPSNPCSLPLAHRPVCQSNLEAPRPTIGRLTTSHPASNTRAHHPKTAIVTAIHYEWSRQCMIAIYPYTGLDRDRK